MQRFLFSGILLALVAGLSACSDSSNDGAEPTAMEAKPTFDWGYPKYSEYNGEGQHVGKTIYQTDPACIERLTFYECAFINAETPDNHETNPTNASRAMTGGMDSCTDAIVAQEPSYCIPADVCNPTMQLAAWAPGQASTDNLAWQLFLALNWPANPSEPGYPDITKKPGDKPSSGSDHTRTVWLDYPTPNDLFAVPAPCSGDALVMASKVSPEFLSKTTPRGTLDILGGDEEAGGGILVDQNRNIVYFDIRVNRTEWEFIVNQNDYWMTGASLAALKPNLMRDYSDPPGQTPGGFPAAQVTTGATSPGDIGSSEIKSAWKQLTEEEIAGGTYFTHTFTLYDPEAQPDKQCTPKTMGLVGMHIIYQPALFGNPEWVWATFEHKMNVPTAGINDGATKFSFYDPGCVATKTPEQCAAYMQSIDNPEDFKCCENLELYATASDPLQQGLVPNQVTRPVNPTVSTILPTDCTGFYGQAITKYFGADNVWNNYFLVSAQWPLRGSSTNFPAYSTGTIANFPCILRNSTMESYAVDLTPPSLNGCSANTENNFCRPCNGDCVATAEDAATACPGGMDSTAQFTTADCMGCHGMYAGQNSSFIFTHRPCCTLRTGALPNTCGNNLSESDCTANTQCVWASSDPNCQ